MSSVQQPIPKCALVTGASSGIGREIARALAKRGYALILTARREDRLRALAAELAVPVTVIAADLSQEADCHRVYEAAKGKIGLLVNNAGMGCFGYSVDIPLQDELSMIDLNIRATQILTKRFLEDVRFRGGRILNVASAAGYAAGPLMAAYYATKSYLLRYSQGLSAELRRLRLPVTVSVLCPGPVDTEFNASAGVKEHKHGKDAASIAEIAVRGALRGKGVLLPGFSVKCGVLAAKLLPEKLLDRFLFRYQKKKLPVQSAEKEDEP